MGRLNSIGFAQPAASRVPATIQWSRTLIKECGDLTKRIPGLGQTIVPRVLRVRLPLVDFELCYDSRRAKLAVYKHCVIQQQVAGAGGQDRWRRRIGPEKRPSVWTELLCFRLGLH